MKEIVYKKIEEVFENEGNPRKVSRNKLEKLKKSIQDFPEMLELRPIVVTPDNIVLGGNMRYRALRELGYKEIPVVYAELTDKQETEFIVKDNLSYGDWDYDLLRDGGWEDSVLLDWGMDLENEEEIEDNLPKTNDETEYAFSTELDKESNYVVLKFNKNIDFVQIQSLLGLKSTYAKRSNGKPWSKGIGRVVDGVEAIKRIKEGK